MPTRAAAPKTGQRRAFSGLLEASLDLMRLEGRRVKRTRWVHADTCVVAVDVEAVYPVDDPREACFEAETVQFLKEVQSHADASDFEWLRQIGRLYVLESAASEG